MLKTRVEYEYDSIPVTCNERCDVSFKECADEIAPILQIIFTRSLNTQTLPQDWLTANITPVFKKGDGSKPSNY